MTITASLIKQSIETITAEIRESMVLLEVAYGESDEEAISALISCALRSTSTSLTKADDLVKSLIHIPHNSSAWHPESEQCITHSSFPLRLKHAMKEAGLTQKELAERAGVSQGLISKLVLGKAEESRKILAISHALNVTPDWLLYGTAEMYPANFSADNREV
ncbi:helix-turn-helix domain-containing protein [Morganella morganii]|uniref:helix-turn-helix domain-containing protein n=1 Tax=Morganella morganii TaxID=582 RepID=UPI0034E47195